MKLTDTHCHLYWNKFDGDREAVIQRAVDAGVTRMLVPGVDGESSRQAIALAEAHNEIYAAAGFHPTDLDKFSEEDFAQVKELAGHPKVAAIGEIGLDHYWVKEEAKRERQRELLRRQLAFAAEIGKPVIIHMREEGDAWFGEASIQLLDILTAWASELKAKDHSLAARPGVLHSFNGNLETAQNAIAMGFFIGVTGPVTYKNAELKRNIISQLPITKLLIETDSPFLAPAPRRGKRNEPAFVREIADKIAEITSRSKEEVAALTTENAARLFLW
ncbi:MAG: TatD family hydrolase [Chloroflexota bacterium]